MKNKNGFTLVELIGVITLLAVVALISVPIVNSSIKKSKEKAYEAQINSIVSGAKKWVVQNGSKNDADFQITLEELIDAGMIENDVVIDPRDDSDMLATGACVFVNYNNASSSYSYMFSANCTK